MTISFTKPIRTLSATILFLASSTAAQANFLQNNELSVGVETGTLTGGLSVKYPYSDTLTVQGIVGAIGTLTTFTARGLYHFSGFNAAQFYGYGSAGFLRASGNLITSSETAFGVGGGIGVEYDLQKAFPALPALSLDAEIGATLVNFDNFSSFNVLNLGLGVHYRF